MNTEFLESLAKEYREMSWGERQWHKNGHVFIAICDRHGVQQKVVFEDRKDFNKVRRYGLMCNFRWLYGYSVRAK